MSYSEASHQGAPDALASDLVRPLVGHLYIPTCKMSSRRCSAAQQEVT